MYGMISVLDFILVISLFFISKITVYLIEIGRLLRFYQWVSVFIFILFIYMVEFFYHYFSSNSFLLSAFYVYLAAL